MTPSSPAPLLDVDVRPGKPPLLNVELLGDPARWVAEHRQALRAALAEQGALLVRGLGLCDVAQVEAVFRGLGDLVIEREAFAPRRCHAPGVYSSSQWPPAQPMCLHHELSYALECPSLLLLVCLTPATAGGATPLADSSAVLRALPRDLVDHFDRVGWVLTRNYNDEIGASLADSFGTDDPAAVERYCLANAIVYEWLPDGGLRTRQRRSAIFTHPLRGLRSWFNQIAFLNEWTLDPEVREYMVDVYGADHLPFNTCFGDGEPIGPDVVHVIHRVYEEHAVREPWQAGDLMLVDNLRTAHGRDPFVGTRELVVAMADAGRVAAWSAKHMALAT